MTGRLPRSGALPIVSDHPENLFTLLRRAYSLRVHEVVTSLCPDCRPDRGSLVERVDDYFDDVRVLYQAGVLPRSFGGGGSSHFLATFRRASLATVDEFGVFRRELTTDHSSATLHYMHLLMPHAPWRHLPSGREYGRSRTDGVGRDELWGDDPWLVRQGYQRHLLQVGYTDALLGRLVRTLRKSALYDRALLVVVADHGVSFQGGSRSESGRPGEPRGHRERALVREVPAAASRRHRSPRGAGHRRAPDRRRAPGSSCPGMWTEHRSWARPRYERRSASQRTKTSRFGCPSRACSGRPWRPHGERRRGLEVGGTRSTRSARTGTCSRAMSAGAGRRPRTSECASTTTSVTATSGDHRGSFRRGSRGSSRSEGSIRAPSSR